MKGLIKALRASRHDEAKVVQAALGDIASEIKSNDWELKAGAVLKLTYVFLFIEVICAHHLLTRLEHRDHSSTCSAIRT